MCNIVSPSVNLPPCVVNRTLSCMSYALTLRICSKVYDLVSAKQKDARSILSVPSQHKSFTPLHPLRLDSGDRHRVDDVLNGGAA